MQLHSHPRTSRHIVEALSLPDAPLWKAAYDKEMMSLKEHHVWDVVRLPPGAHEIGSRLVFDKKLKPDGTVQRYKARLSLKVSVRKLELRRQ